MEDKIYEATIKLTESTKEYRRLLAESSNPNYERERAILRENRENMQNDLNHERERMMERIRVRNEEAAHTQTHHDLISERIPPLPPRPPTDDENAPRHPTDEEIIEDERYNDIFQSVNSPAETGHGRGAVPYDMTPGAYRNTWI